jgi:hypothetical protein
MGDGGDSPLARRHANAIRRDRAYPFRRASCAIEHPPPLLNYGDWLAQRMFLFVPAQAVVAKYLETFKEFPPRGSRRGFFAQLLTGGGSRAYARLNECRIN